MFLIVDDRNLDCLITEKVIDKTGERQGVKIYNSAVEILHDIKSGLLDYNGLTVILLDIMMPVMNGFQFVEEFESLPESVKSKFRIISMTTSLDNNDFQRMLRYSSVIGVLQKPFNLEDLKVVLSKIA